MRKENKMWIFHKTIHKRVFKEEITNKKYSTRQDIPAREGAWKIV